MTRRERMRRRSRRLGRRPITLTPDGGASLLLLALVMLVMLALAWGAK